MRHWTYFALTLSTASTVGIVVQMMGCGLDPVDLDGQRKGKCRPSETTICECQTNQDCIADFCNVATCVDGQCKTTSANEGNELPAADQVDKDCNVKKCIGGESKNEPDPNDKCDKGACTSAGECVECNVDTDCATGGYCHQNKCASCSNGMMDGDETGLDCGEMSRCGLCNGAPCPVDPMMCHTGVCADGFCCDATCGDNCKSCNVKGKEGTCTNVLAGDTDAMCQMQNNTKACDGMGACVMGTPNGIACAIDTNCISMKCTNGMCTSP